MPQLTGGVTVRNTFPFVDKTGSVRYQIWSIATTTVAKRGVTRSYPCRFAVCQQTPSSSQVPAPANAWCFRSLLHTLDTLALKITRLTAQIFTCDFTLLLYDNLEFLRRVSQSHTGPFQLWWCICAHRRRRKHPPASFRPGRIGSPPPAGIATGRTAVRTTTFTPQIPHHSCRLRRSAMRSESEFESQSQSQSECPIQLPSDI